MQTVLNIGSFSLKNINLQFYVSLTNIHTLEYINLTRLLFNYAKMNIHIENEIMLIYSFPNRNKLYEIHK